MYPAGTKRWWRDNNKTNRNKKSAMKQKTQTKPNKHEKKKTQKKMPPKNEKNREHQKTGKPQQTIATARTSSVAQKISLCKLCSS